jgi:hypothetical protein
VQADLSACNAQADAPDGEPVFWTPSGRGGVKLSLRSVAPNRPRVLPDRALQTARNDDYVQADAPDDFPVSIVA